MQRAVKKSNFKSTVSDYSLHAIFLVLHAGFVCLEFSRKNSISPSSTRALVIYILDLFFLLLRFAEGNNAFSPSLN